MVDSLETHIKCKHNVKKKKKHRNNIDSPIQNKISHFFSMKSKWDFCGFALFIVNFISKVLNKELENPIDTTNSI